MPPTVTETSRKDSYRRILHSSSVIGMASILNILFGILRMKAVAVMFGPGGVGLVGLFQNVMQTGAAIASLGTGTTAIRQISAVAALHDPQTLTAARQALRWGSITVALIGGSAFWVFGKPITTRLLGVQTLDADVVWLAAGIAVAILSGAQVAILTGLQRVRDVARVQVVSGLVGSAIGIVLLWMFGRQALAAIVVVGPLCSVLAGLWYVRLLPGAFAPGAPIAMVQQQWWQMVRPGIAYMLAGLVNLLALLTVRTLVQQDLGIAALGQFQAAWTISMTYLSFVLAAMATDYYARVSAQIGNDAVVCDLINEQTEVALLLCGPVLLGMIAFAPWVIRLMYGPEFTDATNILRWQLLGDVFRVMSWPLAYLMLALGAGRALILSEALGMAVFITATAVLLPVLHYTATGPAFVLLYGTYLPAIWWVARKRIDFRWRRAVLQQAGVLIVAAMIISCLAQVSDNAATGAGGVSAVFFAGYTLLRLRNMDDAYGRLSRVVKLGKKLARWVSR
jgi:O-antigen/teichoic acid export membrane protein